MREWADIVWVYMGPRDNVPELPQLELGLVPASSRYVSKKWQDCNWVQSLEGAIDTAHFSFLHTIPSQDEKTKLEIFRSTSAIGAGKELQDRIRWVMDDPRPRFAIAGHDTGLVIGAARKTDSTDKYWRISQFLMPNHALVPVAFPGDVYHGQCWVPVDDVNCWIYTYSWLPDRPFTNSEREKYAKGLSLHAEVDDDYVPVRNIRNDYMLDREKQKTESFTGIMRRVSEQDAAIQDSQGPIQDRTREHLGPTDVGIVEFRKMVMGAARALSDRRRAQGCSCREALCRARRRLDRRAGQGSRHGDDRALRPSRTAMSAANTVGIVDRTSRSHYRRVRILGENVVTIKIYGPAASRAARALWIVHELDIPFEHIAMEMKDLKSPDYLKVNPNGKVPALVDGDFKLFESMAINLYLAAQASTRTASCRRASRTRRCATSGASGA